jgi:DNA mismatch endonuclease (patch repair protein)
MKLEDEGEKRRPRVFCTRAACRNFQFILFACRVTVLDGEVTKEPAFDARGVIDAQASAVGGSWASTPAVRRSMQGNKSKDTKPELAVRRLLHARGFRFRVGIRPVATIRRTADIVFTRSKIAVFVDGCFWHGCPVHYVPPKSNSEFWSAKLESNIARDAATTAALDEHGWVVLRFWEHSCLRDVVDRIGEVVALRGEPRTSRTTHDGEA